MLNILTGLLTQNRQGLQGNAKGVYNIEGLTYQSSIDPNITNIKARVVYDTGLSNMPILLLIHGWDDDYLAFNVSSYERFASYGFLVIGVGMRMRLGSKGTRDISALETHDIYDAINYAKFRYGNLIDNNRTIAVGYSNGGALALELGVKFPDSFSLIVDFFGISDYGYNDTSSWYIINPFAQYTDPMDTYIGSPRTSYKNEYLSRETRQAFGKNFKGKLRIYHDEDDSAVDVSHSDDLLIQLINEGFSNYQYSRTTAASPTRWLHEYPNGSNNVIQAENEWKEEALNLTNKGIPNQGTILVRGYIVTKKFKIWLNAGDNRSANVIYDVDNDSYTVTPILETGATDVTVTITQFDGKSASQTISSETVMIVS